NAQPPAVRVPPCPFAVSSVICKVQTPCEERPLTRDSDCSDWYSPGPGGHALPMMGSTLSVRVKPVLLDVHPGPPTQGSVNNLTSTPSGVYRNTSRSSGRG